MAQFREGSGVAQWFDPTSLTNWVPVGGGGRGPETHQLCTRFHPKSAELRSQNAEGSVEFVGARTGGGSEPESCYNVTSVQTTVRSCLKNKMLKNCLGNQDAHVPTPALKTPQPWEGLLKHRTLFKWQWVWQGNPDKSLTWQPGLAWNSLRRLNGPRSRTQIYLACLGFRSARIRLKVCTTTPARFHL